MALSIQTLIESAINYTYAYALETQKTADELQTMMPSPGRFPIQVSLCRLNRPDPQTPAIAVTT